MSLDRLPEELFVIIVEFLDTVSVANLYKAGNNQIRSRLCMPGVIKDCTFSMNSLATVHTLKTPFFRDIAYHLQEINMCGVPNLCKTALKTALAKMKNLLALDVSYTNINLIDLLDIYDVCDTITVIAVDYYLPKDASPVLMKRLKEMFRDMEIVTFVGSFADLILGSGPHSILEYADLNILEYIVTKLKQVWVFPNPPFKKKPLRFNHFSLYYIHWVQLLENPYMDYPFDFDFETVYVLVVYRTNHKHKVNCSEMFIPFFAEKFGIDAEPLCSVPSCKYDRNFGVPGIEQSSNFIKLFWNLGTTVFNEVFYDALFRKLNPIFPRNYDEPTSQERNWFLIREIDPPERPAICSEGFKKRRVAPENIILFYDQRFKNFKEVQLSLDFQAPNPLALPQGSDYLRKLTFLSLTGLVYYTQTFFRTLFQSCGNLVTLNVEAPNFSPCATLIQKSIPLSSSLKNFRFVDKMMDFKTLFSALSQCRTLEVIALHQTTSLNQQTIASPETIFANCPNLYYMSIHLTVSEPVLKKIKSIFNKAKAKHDRSYLRLQINCKGPAGGDTLYNFDPFLSVFRLDPIRNKKRLRETGHNCFR